MSQKHVTLLQRPLQSLRPSYDGPASWLWFVGTARIGVLLLVTLGASRIATQFEFSYFLALIYTGAFASSLWYLVALRREQAVSAALTWTQMLVDFGVVAVTISFTGGLESPFTFLLVIVILEAGVLMGLVQGFVFATLASVFMFFQFGLSAVAAPDPLTHWYDFLIQAIAFFFTAFISGYWNQRVSRMKQFQREILDNMNSGFLITDEKGLVVAINRSACQILDLVEGSVVGRHVDGVIRPESEAECPVTTALRLSKDFASYEFDAVIRGEQVKLLGLTTNRIKDERGHVTGLIASFTDLTEMAQMRQELQQQDRMAAIGEQLSGLAHEIRNPVAAIRGAIEELNNSIGDPAMAQRLAGIALREAGHLNEIVTGFLDFARDPQRHRDAVALREMVEEVAADIRRRHGQGGGLHVVVDMPKEALAVLGNPTQLRQVFTNIAQNAVEAMHEQGTLSIVLRKTRGPIELRFDDDGPGIAPDKVARIFEPFYTSKERGVGMGLAVCMRIMTAHNGTIRVASRSGRGASMIVSLPAAPNGLGVAEGPKKTPARQQD